MYIDREVLSEYPFHGTFYTVEDNVPEDGDMLKDNYPSDGDLLSEEDDENVSTEEDLSDTKVEVVKKVVLEVMCDIQETNKIFTNNGGAAYSDVFFKFDKSVGIKIKVGDRFKSDDWYRNIDGLVVGVNPTQMGGCLVHIMEGGV